MAFTTVAEGNLAAHVGDDPAAVAARRARLARELGLPAAAHFMSQTHSTAVGRIAGGEGAAESQLEVDALVSRRADAPLAVLTADCLPIVFAAYGERGSAIAVAHAGRRGLLEGILANALDELREEAGPEATVTAWVGPAICGRCYEVPADLQRDAEALIPGVASTTSWGTPALDLPSAAARFLTREGVDVVRSEICTFEDARYYSYRRDRDAGRLAGVVWREPGQTSTASNDGE
ncbi:polyphenol oxidase family protein [Zhihengliuella flava]|uniref:YfiH family protein n=1 Tax=Zhihengliuella flava TaxID=1285193 RepID=A0A931GGC4_9MICC|nr:YfiH family protein [Zhihengliuella flava]